MKNYYRQCAIVLALAGIPILILMINGIFLFNSATATALLGVLLPITGGILLEYGMSRAAAENLSHNDLKRKMKNIALKFSPVVVALFFACIFIWLKLNKTDNLVLITITLVGVLCFFVLLTYMPAGKSSKSESSLKMFKMTPEIESLQARAKAGDVKAAAQFIVLKWNAHHTAGTLVTYFKSPLEGKIVLKTKAAAYVLGDEAVVELEHVGTAMLKKIELFTG